MDDELFNQAMGQFKADSDRARLADAGGPGPIHDFATALDRVASEAALAAEMEGLRDAASRFDLSESFNGGRCVWTFVWSIHQARALLELGAPIEAQDDIDPAGGLPALTPLGTAILRCDSEMAALLLAHGADPCALTGRFRAFELCEAEAQEAFGMAEATHPLTQIETRELLRPLRERFELSAATPNPEEGHGDSTKRL